ncbi:glycoside hydrolase family 93 protein [Diplodia corticola]|uniref:Glycoside hydrolase family 93 protein n=1 Tax=Diplodia corticola TaxID=236234 RepID=A0A1J9RIZ1_9PEZI|nr:glycoside hydrolase family 93 protein [Diplodia corticola]OJD40624.1 glycoside hydrolase family 93 protein [Diplodia corticola]
MLSPQPRAWLTGLCALLAATSTTVVASPTSLHRRAGLTPSLSGALNPMSTGSSTYPRANFLSSGAILGAFTAFPSGTGESVITLASSPDSGVTWNPLGTAASGPTNTTDIDNPFPIELPGGRLLVAFRNHDQELDQTYTYFRITVCYSDDGGASWAYLSTPASDPGAVNGNWEPFMRLDGDTLQLYYSRETSAADQDSLVRTSTDGGATWSSATTFTGAELTNARDGMLGVAEFDGGLIAVFETETGGGKFHIGAVTYDGTSWGDRRVVYESDGFNAQAPQVANVGGTLVVSFQTDEDGDYVVKVVTSADGTEWADKTTVMEATSQWAGLLTLDDSSFLVMAGNNGVASAQKVVLN